MIIDMGMCLRVPYNDPSKSNAVTDVARGGTARRLMKPQGVCGKHNYMSPEVFSNTESLDGFAIDLWAAGVILYISECLYVFVMDYDASPYLRHFVTTCVS